MDKRYQVFVSSTYSDLIEERLEVMKALLELDCFPSGMEYFPAANEDQWSFIRELIDQCDYYIVVIAGRYGSVDSKGVSYTEKEYLYALEKQIPVIGFLHTHPNNIPDGKTEHDPANRRKLEDFRALVRSKLCKEWSSAAELGAVVSRSLTQLIRRNPRPGWVRSTHIASLEASEEILRLRQLTDRQAKEIERLSLAKPAGSDSLAQGEDEIEISYTVTLSDRGQHYPYQHHRSVTSDVYTWDEVFKCFAPYLLAQSRITSVKSSINRLLKESVAERVYEEYPNLDLGAVTVSESSLQLIIVQFTALGFVEIMNTVDERGKEIRMAQLTQLGRQYLITVTAVKRGIRAIGKSDEDTITSETE